MTNLRSRLERLEGERATCPNLTPEQVRELACRQLVFNPRRIYQPRWIRVQLGISDPCAEEIERRLLRFSTNRGSA